MNKWIIKGKYAYTDLKHGRCWVDKIYLPVLKQFKWRSHVGRKGPYVQTGNNKNGYWLHRFLLRLGTFPMEGDHKDRDGMNNRIENLRFATHQQNSCNRRMPPNKAGAMGIKKIVRPKSVSFLARVTNRRIVHSKCFPTLKEAINWRNQKAQELHGIYAVIV